MKYEHYRELYSQLRKPADVDHLAKKYGLDPELLFVMYTQRTVRDATRRFYASRGYEEVARIRGYYRPDDDLVVFGVDVQS